MKPKTNRKTKGNYDNCQTPPYALEPLYPYLSIDWHIWECAVGKGVLARALGAKGYSVVVSDKEIDFLQVKANIGNDVIVTNPPYSIKYEWLVKCYELGSPFALLMPVEMLGTKKGQELFKDRIEIIFMTPRVDFYMPNKGWEGGGAQFPTAWFTWKLNLPQQINFAALNKPKRNELKEYWEKYL